MLKHHGYRGEVAVMHSDIPQKERMEALKGFKSGKYDILVATDVAARGIDISGVTHVINYRVPETRKTMCTASAVPAARKLPGMRSRS